MEHQSDERESEPQSSKYVLNGKQVVLLEDASLHIKRAGDSLQQVIEDLEQHVTGAHPDDRKKLLDILQTARSLALELHGNIGGALILGRTSAYVVVVEKEEFGDGYRYWPTLFRVSRSHNRRFGQLEEEGAYLDFLHVGVFNRPDRIFMRPLACDGSESIQIPIDDGVGWTNARNTLNVLAFSTSRAAELWVEERYPDLFVIRPDPSIDDTGEQQHLDNTWQT